MFLLVLFAHLILLMTYLHIKEFLVWILADTQKKRFPQNTKKKQKSLVHLLCSQATNQMSSSHNWNFYSDIKFKTEKLKTHTFWYVLFLHMFDLKCRLILSRNSWLSFWPYILFLPSRFFFLSLALLMDNLSNFQSHQRLKTLLQILQFFGDYYR